MELGPGFLEETDPKLIISASREARLAISSNREMLVHNNRRFLTIEEELNQVNTCLIDSLGHKHLLDAIWELS